MFFHELAHVSHVAGTFSLLYLSIISGRGLTSPVCPGGALSVLWWKYWDSIWKRQGDILVNVVPMDTLTHGCLNMHGGVPIVLYIFVDPL